MCMVYRDVDKVHDLMDDIGEQMDLANEVNDAIASPIGFGQDIDQSEKTFMTSLASFALLPRDVDKVHDLMDEVAEQQDIANEISEAISNPVGFGTDVDEDELMAELEELEQEDLDAQLLEVGGPVTDQLPSVPVSEPVAKTKGKAQADADDDLAELEMWAS
ncbi:charged multivesicular body protein 4b [Lingula anatina]|uniref:Charged multivesicular body protein 4b n=1 Tax=Lingula anatina TaxID=7574 RepID=A0A2R2MJ89_LINAN|nr:charged multivesicular body protein 4b [Lingula anatina]|eukprot:XP_023930275.1 charged multivesicular body protein 4b [Lingula anatina]